jgi:Ca-activated chloride channel homolog
MARMMLALACAIGLPWFTGAFLPAQAGFETKSIPVTPADTLVVNNDHGSIRIRAAKSDTLEVQFRKRTRGAAQASFRVDYQRTPDTVSFRSLFSGYPGETVDYEIQAPGFLNVKISGANPAVEIGGMRGNVRIDDRAGMIVTENLTSSVAITTDTGDIVYRANFQPEGDARIESASGNIYFELAENLNLRGQFRAGGTITWNREPAVAGKPLERQLGSQGPSLYAAAGKGNVEVRFSERPQVIGAAAPPPRAEPPDSGRAAQKAQDPPKPVDAAPATARDTTAGAQQPPAPAGGYSLKVNVDTVSLNVAVVDRDSGRSIGQLQKEDFLVYEDGVAQQVDTLAHEEAPFNLLLLLDVSGSTQSFIEMMKQAAIDFTRQIQTSDRIAVATFNSSVQLILNFTNDRNAAAQAIRRIMPGGGTAFYDALSTCIDQYMRDVEGRSAIVVFTDGVDNQLYGAPGEGSFTRFDELYRKIQEIEPIIYPIFLDTQGMFPTGPGGPGTSTTGAVIGVLGDIIRKGGIPGTYPPTTNPAPVPNPAPAPRRPTSSAESAAYAEAMRQLQTIADQTGGRFYSPRRIEELSRAYAQVADDLRIQYQLAYGSTNHKNDGRWREIRVQIKNHPKAVVRTRKGYYARKDTGSATAPGL